MDPKIRTLTIERFRAFDSLTVDGLGRVNLITGRNNTGKSSLLEALRILASDGSPTEILRILRYREEYSGDSGEGPYLRDDDILVVLSSLFRGYPSTVEAARPFAISTKGCDRPRRLAVSIGRFVESHEADGTHRLVLKPAAKSGDVGSVLGLLVEGEAGKRIWPIEKFEQASFWPSYRGGSDASELPYIYLSPYEPRHTSALGHLWDEVALSDEENDVLDALRILAPDIEKVSMIGGERSWRGRTAIVRGREVPRPVPLRSYGDGFNRLFGIALSLVGARHGLLLIDEVENGIHHSALVDLWREIFRLAGRLNVQVFATSHSWETIVAFQQAAGEAPEDGALLRLARWDDKLYPTVFRGRDLAIVARDRIEVR
jgi:hypothetical protein